MSEESQRIAIAEACGWSDEGYQVALEAISVQYEQAEKTIAEWDAEQASFEAARSLLSMAKETLKTLEG